jgi:hypothetical protein
MRVPKPVAITFLALFALVLGNRVSRVAAKHVEYHPKIDPADFQETVDNPYFPLVPGTTFHFTETEGKGSGDDEVFVTRDRKTILGISCVVVRDTVKENGKVQEETFDWYAQDKHGTVWYMGEDTKEYSGSGKVSTAGSWEAGKDGAMPGVVMTREPAPGAPYYQEYYPGHAEDMGQIVALGEKVTVPYGTFEGCVRTKEWSPIEHGKETKWYAKGVGFIKAEAGERVTSTLVSITPP